MVWILSATLSLTEREDYFLFLARTTWRVKNLKTAIAWANDLKVKLKIIGGRGISAEILNTWALLTMLLRIKF